MPNPREAPVMTAYPSFFISVLVQRTADGLRKASIEDAVPKTSGDAKTFVNSARAVMVKVIFLDAPEKRKPRIREVQRVVQPFFSDIALHNAGEHDRRGINREEKAYRGRNKKQRQNIFQFTANVTAIKRSLVMIPMERIEPLMQEPPDESFS